MTSNLSAPFPYFGGKRTVAELVWSRFGNVDNYVEPFVGSMAVLLGKPDVDLSDLPLETVNDADGFLVNFWRALQNEPEEVAIHATNIVNEVDLTARHLWLVNSEQDLLSKMMVDPDYYDPKIAGWWVWGLSSWTGGEWCSGTGSWHEQDGLLVNTRGTDQTDHIGVSKRLPHLGDAGMGVNKKSINNDNHIGVSKRLPHLGDAGMGVNKKSINNDNMASPFAPSIGLIEWFNNVAHRIRRVRIVNGDFERVLSPAVTFRNGLTGVFLDPPYLQHDRYRSLYSHEEVDTDCASRSYHWACANGSNPLLRIAICCYEGHFPVPEGWSVSSWKTQGGYGNRNREKYENRYREIIMFSPHCLTEDKEPTLFGSD